MNEMPRPDNQVVLEPMREVDDIESVELREWARNRSRALATHPFIIKREGTEVGYLALDYGPPLRYLVLYEIYLLPTHRGNQTGTTILNMVHDIAEREGCSEIILRPKPLEENGENFLEKKQRLIRWYSQNGYRRDSESEVMRKTLVEEEDTEE